MGIFSDDEDDELFDLFMLNEINEDSTSSNSKKSGGGCLTCFLLMMAVPIGAILISASVLM